MSDTIKCSWNGRGGPLEYGGRDWPRDEIEAGIPLDVAKGLQSFRGPDFLILWPAPAPEPVPEPVPEPLPDGDPAVVPDVVSEPAPEPPAKGKKPSKKGKE